MIALAWLVALAVLAMPPGFFWCCCNTPPYTVCKYVAPYGCNGTGDFVSGLTVTVTGPYGYSDSQVTGVSGAYFCGLGPGTFTYTVLGADRFATKTGTFVISSPADNNTTTSIPLVPGVGYQCFCAGLTYPVAETIYLTGPGISGAVTLTWGGSYWTGSGTFNYAGTGCCGLSGGSQTVTWYVCKGSTTLQVDYLASPLNGCPGVSRTFTGGKTSITSATEPPAFTATWDVSDPFGSGTLWDGLGSGTCNASVTYTVTE